MNCGSETTEKIFKARIVLNLEALRNLLDNDQFHNKLLENFKQFATSGNTANYVTRRASSPHPSKLGALRPIYLDERGHNFSFSIQIIFFGVLIYIGLIWQIWNILNLNYI